MSKDIFHFSGYLDSPLGTVKMCASATGITSLQFSTTSVLEENTNIIIEQCKRELAEYFESARKEFSVPIDLQCSTFQKQVLSYVSKISIGATSSYLQVAQEMSMPTASRAIGMANSKNKILILIPCHRIVGHNGRLVGYAGELHRKQWLLDHEAKVCGIVKEQLSLQFKH